MAWANKNREREYNKKYRESHREELNKKDIERWKNKYYNDPVFRDSCLERARLYKTKNKNRRLKLRFQIFQRDKFTCQYCGRKAPNVIIHIDHIFPKSKGGLNKKDNYITACFECNLGKSDCLL